MATERRPSNPTLEDAGSSNAGAALSLKNEGDAHDSGGTNYQGALAFKDPSGNLIFAKTNAAGEIIVETESSEFACLDSNGVIDDGSASLAIATSLTLQASKEYDRIEVLVSSFRDTVWILEHVDDDGGGGEVVNQLAKGRLISGGGGGQECCMFECLQFTSGGTGVQTLRVRANNLNALSDIDVMLACREDQT